MQPRLKYKKNRCPRCKSARIDKRLDGSRWCERCGQRISREGILIPSSDRRESVLEREEQLILL